MRRTPVTRALLAMIVLAGHREAGMEATLEVA